MRRVRQRTLLLCSLGLSAVLVPDSKNVYAQAAGAAVLQGHVVADTGQPVRRATVRVSMPGNGPWLTTTDASGSFRLDGLPVARVIVTASKAGFVTMGPGQTDPFASTTSTTLQASPQANDVTIRLIRGAALVGRVIDEFGDPVAEGSVRAYHAEYSGGGRRLMPVRVDQTDDLGQFRLFGLAAGRYYVAANWRTDTPDAPAPTTRGGSGFAQTFYPGTTSAGDATVISVTAGRDATGLEFALLPARLAHVGGVATSSNGRPASGYIAMLTPAGPVSAMGFAPAEVQPDGRFGFSNVAPGAYRVDIRPKAAFEAVGRGAGIGALQQTDADVASVPIVVNGDDIDSLNVVLSRGFTVSGQLRAEGVRPDAMRAIEISAWPMDGGPGLSQVLLTVTVRPDATGAFTLRGLSGHYLIRAIGLLPGLALKSVRATVEVADDGVSITSDMTNVTITVGREASVAGSVAVRDGAPNAYSVVLFSSNRDTWGKPFNRFTKSSAVTSDGTFAFQSLPAGEYLASIVQGLEPGEWAEAASLQALEHTATKFTLGDGEAKTLVLRTER